MQLEKLTENNKIQDLLTYVDNSPTSFQAADYTKKILEKNGFEELNERDKWNIAKNKKYFVTRNDSAIVAFKTGKENFVENGFNIVGTHLDSPALKIKPESQVKTDNYLQVAVEVYGGPIIHTWLDKELSIAGRVVVKDRDNKTKSVLIDFEKPMAIIPNAAIHMNRKVNADFKYNRQTHLKAIISTTSEDDSLLNSLIAKELEIEKENILDFDLFFYDCQKANLVGNDDLIVAGRLDNLQMSHSMLDSFLESDFSDKTQVAAFFDNEEVGSRTLQGANSSLLETILRRIILADSQDSGDFFRAIANSFLISADGAHAFHPNFSSHHDPSYKPFINKGPVIKINANFRYTSTAETSVFFANLCEKVNVPHQKFIIKSDMGCGSTIGPMSSASLGIKAVDVGNAMWAMHSIRETAGALDHLYMTKVLKEFYESK